MHKSTLLNHNPKLPFQNGFLYTMLRLLIYLIFFNFENNSVKLIDFELLIGSNHKFAGYPRDETKIFINYSQIFERGL